MKILVIPDIHQKISKANLILQRESFDKVVFLGDYFDGIGNINSIKETCDWLKETYYRLGDKAIWLIGNHDISYFEEVTKGRQFARRWFEKVYCCSGYSRNKAKIVVRVDMKDFFYNLKILHYEEGFLFSHAGIHPSKLKPFISLEDNFKTYKEEWEDVKPHLHFKKTRLYDIGELRGGNKPYGDILWLDWSNFEHIDGLPQIVGHTGDSHVRKNGDSYCIDCHLDFYGMVDDGKFSIKEF